ncbi:MAG: hypothetical protein JSV04_10940 [Candidatus Heimdallarchaeota archaeon]|nr:MAG: hypothetical protein JSV04_10940 [Candidatus Heimdallarchaeota archaeon]
MASLKKILIMLALIAIVLLGGILGFNLVLISLDKDPPTIVSVGYDPHPEVNSSTTVQIFVNDVSGIKSCTIYYRINNSDWISHEMRRYVILCCPPRYLIRLGPFTSIGAQYDFYFKIIDQKDNIFVSETYSFTVINVENHSILN